MADRRAEAAQAIDSMRTHTDRQSTIKDAMIELVGNDVEGDEFSVQFNEFLLPEFLYHPEIIRNTLFFKNLRMVLDSMNIRVGRKSGFLISQATTNSMYEVAYLTTVN